MQQTSHPTPRLDSLPTELLIAILAHLPPPHIALGSGAAPAQRNALFALQRTSKRLEEVCTPVLWDRLEMDIGPAGRGETGRVVEQLRASQERATACRKLRLEAFDWGFLPPFAGPGERLLPNVEELSMRETMPITLDVVARFDRASLSLSLSSSRRRAHTHCTQTCATSTSSTPSSYRRLATSHSATSSAWASPTRRSTFPPFAPPPSSTRRSSPRSVSSASAAFT